MWNIEMVKIVRHMIDDLDESNYRYADGRLEEAILLSGQNVQTEATFQTTYVCDIDNLLLSPDPTDRAANTRDDNFINLTCLKAACLFDFTEARLAAKRNISIKDGRSSITMSGASDARLKLLAVGWCKLYSDAKYDYVNSGLGVIGAAIISPFRLSAYETFGPFNSSRG